MNDLDDENWNEDVLEDVQPTNLQSLVVFSRDWTVETIVSQIDKGNIELNPITLLRMFCTTFSFG